MTEAAVPPPRTPYQVLADLGDLTRRVRAAQRGGWFPLLLLSALTLGGILADRLTFSLSTGACPVPHGPAGGGAGCVMVKQGSPVYWTVGLVLAYAATAVFYIRRSGNRGVGTVVRPYVLAGIGIAVLFGARALWMLHFQAGDAGEFWGLHPDPGSGRAVFLSRLGGEASAIGLPLLVLARAERNRALLLFTLGYLAIGLAPISTGWAGLAVSSPWSSVPGLAVPGVYLLLGALGFGLARVSRRRRP